MDFVNLFYIFLKFVFSFGVFVFFSNIFVLKFVFIFGVSSFIIFVIIFIIVVVNKDVIGGGIIVFSIMLVFGGFLFGS